MGYSMKLRGAVCFAALLAGGAAQADVSAEQVWNDWKTQMSMYDQSTVTTGSEELSGGTLTVRDMSVTTTTPDMTTKVSIDEIQFSEQGDGSVLITMSESYPMALTTADGAVINIEYTQSGVELVVSGDESLMNYAITGDSVKMALVDVVNGDITFTGDAQIVMNDLSGTYSTSQTETRNIDYAVDAGSIDLLVDFMIPGEDGGYVTGGGKIEGISMNAVIALPLEMDAQNPQDFFNNGMAISGGYSIDNSSYIFDIDAEGDQAAGSVSTGATVFDLEVNSEKVVYDINANDVAMSITGSEIPFPIDVALSSYGIGLEMPFAKSDEPQDFGLGISLIDLTVNDMIWNILDPGAVLPRDPATLQFDLSGTATPLFDILDPEQAMMMAGEDMPVELNTLTLNDLKIAIAGAMITGAGDFTFDPTDMQSFAPMPRPEGEVSIKVNGLNQLIDNLIAMGLIPEEQVMGPRMMMGMFARTTGDDQLETTLEVNAEAHVLVNGQRIK